MSYQVQLTKGVDKVIRKWIKYNPQLAQKVHAVLLELAEHPRTGIGHPEALKGGHDITSSTP